MPIWCVANSGRVITAPARQCDRIRQSAIYSSCISDRIKQHSCIQQHALYSHTAAAVLAPTAQHSTAYCAAPYTCHPTLCVSYYPLRSITHYLTLASLFVPSNVYNCNSLVDARRSQRQRSEQTDELGRQLRQSREALEEMQERYRREIREYSQVRHTHGVPLLGHAVICHSVRLASSRSLDGRQASYTQIWA